MACRFCPKIKRWDLLWIVVMCTAMWVVNKYYDKNDNSATAKKQAITHNVEQEELDQTRKLQKECMYGNTKACNEVYEVK